MYASIAPNSFGKFTISHIHLRIWSEKAARTAWKIEVTFAWLRKKSLASGQHLLSPCCFWKHQGEWGKGRERTSV